MKRLRRFLARDSVKGACFLLGVVCGAVALATDTGTPAWRIAVGVGAALAGLGVYSGGHSGMQPPPPRVVP